LQNELNKINGKIQTIEKKFEEDSNEINKQYSKAKKAFSRIYFKPY
jgi:peptidoglycan hydrolase CwlO-like protein